MVREASDLKATGSIEDKAGIVNEKENAIKEAEQAGNALLNDSGVWAQSLGAKKSSEASENLLAMATMPKKEAAAAANDAEDFNIGKMDINQQVNIANEFFADQLKRAGTPQDKADILRKMGENRYYAARKNDIATDEGKKIFREHLSLGMDNYNDALKLMNGKNSAEDKIIQANILGNLALCEMSRAEFSGDKYAVGAEQHYNDALKIWREHDTSKEANPKEAADIKDKAMLTLLSQVGRLYKALGNTEKTNQTYKEFEEIFLRHPELKVRK